MIDDGRRFLKRTAKQFDVIAIDPLPPLQAAGLSLLYSTEFYEPIKQHLKPKGIVQVWLPGGEKMSDLAVVAFGGKHISIRPLFSIRGELGRSLSRLNGPNRSAQPRSNSVARMPARAKSDLLEWTSRARRLSPIWRPLFQRKSPWKNCSMQILISELRMTIR